MEESDRDITDYTFALAEKQAAAIYIHRNLHLQKWPKYYQRLMLCYSPYEYQVRYFQIQFCIINRLPFSYYTWLLQLNYHIGVNGIPPLFKRKLEKLFNYVLRQAESNSGRITSYNIFNDGVTDYSNNDLFRRDEIGNYYDSNPRVQPRWCNYRLMRDHLINIGVYYNILPYL